MSKKGILFGAACWLLGLAAFIVGLNVPGNAGRWLTVVGQILFLLGLLLEGVLWFRKKREEGD